MEIGMNWKVKWDILIDKLSNDYYVKILLQGLGNTVKIAVIGLLIGILIGTLIASVKVAPKYNVFIKVLDKICTFYTALFRGTPMIVQLLVTYYVLLPMMGVSVDKLTIGIIVFGMNSGAYCSEIMRSGIQSIDIGQMEGARSIGLSYGASMIKIIIPQAIKNILPTLGNEFISLIKETSVLSFITIVDLYKALTMISTANQQYEFVMPYLLLGLIYIVLVALISLLVKLLEKKLSQGKKA